MYATARNNFACELPTPQSLYRNRLTNHRDSFLQKSFKSLFWELSRRVVEEWSEKLLCSVLNKQKIPRAIWAHAFEFYRALISFHGPEKKYNVPSANGHCTASQYSAMTPYWTSMYTNQPKISS